MHIEGVRHVWEISKVASSSQNFSICVFLKEQRQDSIKKKLGQRPLDLQDLTKTFDWKLCELIYLYNYTPIMLHKSNFLVLEKMQKNKQEVCPPIDI